MQLKLSILTFLFCVASLLNAQTNARPKLVVGIVVDQMSYDFLYRYWENYSDGGFKRLVKDGFSCENHHYNYIPTYTAPGHASIYTGSVPAVHGIISNDWYDKQSGAFMYCSGDSSVKGVGSTLPAGKMSPVNMLTTSICDELKIASNNKSKVIGISLKDRGAILPAGHTANAAYWFDGNTNAWISSTYYMQALPDWVQTFNGKHLANDYISKDWNLLLPEINYTNSTVDNVEWERRDEGETTSVFPHKLSNAKSMEAIKGTPFGNSLTTDFALETIAQEKLGFGNSTTDMLCVSYSSTDYVGHYYGPYAMETEDTYIRLDKDLARLFEFLDSKIGAGNYLVFLTADHGVAPAAGHMQSLKVPSGLISSSALQTQIDSVMKINFPTINLIANFSNDQIFLNHKKLAENNITVAMIYDVLFNYLITVDGVSNVINLSNIANAKLPDIYKTMVVNGVNAKRSGDIQILYESNWMESYKYGSTHGSMYNYDTQVPLLWYGWKIPNGKTWRKTEVTDIAPTLAAMLRIKAPSGCIGRVIDEMK
ncbi:MAG: alkaline phosphatase PafA [Chitinophagales bacterium]